MSHILTLTQNGDKHAEWLQAECERRGVNHTCLFTEEFPQHLQLHIAAGNGDLFECAMFKDGQEINFLDLAGIWFRRPNPPIVAEALDEDYAQFALNESIFAIQDLFQILWDRNWVNIPDKIALAEYKVLQLQVAKNVGFRLPATLISNNELDAKAFFENCGYKIIQKQISPVVVAQDGEDYSLYTSILNTDDFEKHLETISLSPCLFQEWVEKQYELRIHVIGNRVWAAAIYSQHTDLGKTDYRVDIENCIYRPTLLPLPIEDLCLALTKRLNLTMSVIDMIVTPAGEYIFLEINPSGQWAWIEQNTGLPICEALADELLGTDTLSRHPYIAERSLNFNPTTAILGFNHL